jgi:hypothetical protein
MDLQTIGWEQRRHLDEMRDLWRTLGPLLQQRHQFAGGVTWKTVKGYEYLARFQSDRITGSKKFEYLGRRKPETEAVYTRFLQERESLDGRIESLQRRMEIAARVAKALRLGRMPTQAADALRAIWNAGLDRDVLVAGSANLYAYELETGLFAPREAAPEEDLELLSLMPVSEEVTDDLKRALLASDRSYRFSSQSEEFIAKDGYRIRLRERSGFLHRLEDALPRDVEAEALRWAVDLPPVSTVILGRDGRPAQASFVDPRAYLVLTSCSIRAALTSESREEPRLRAAAEMIQREWPDPFPDEFVGLSPILEEAFGAPQSPRI